jgi:hypothetical protein
MDKAVANATYWASLLETIADIAFAIVIVALLVELVCGRIARRYEKQINDAKDLQIAELDNETAKLRSQLAPRLLTQTQQNELAAALAKFKGQRGTIMASPSTPEGEWFVRVLTAPLRAAGWRVDIMPGSATATVLWPSGVVVSYAADISKSIDATENIERSQPAVALVDKLKEYGIAATALPVSMTPPNTIEIIVSAK